MLHFIAEVTVPFKEPQGVGGRPSVPETDTGPYTGVVVNNVPQLGVNLWQKKRKLVGNDLLNEYGYR